MDVVWETRPQALRVYEVEVVMSTEKRTFLVV